MLIDVHDAIRLYTQILNIDRNCTVKLKYFRVVLYFSFESIRSKKITFMIKKISYNQLNYNVLRVTTRDIKRNRRNRN